MRRTKAQKALDAEIDRLFNKHGSGIQFRMLDLPKIYKAGETAFHNGQDMEQAIIDSIQMLRLN